jgi:peptidyl-dipeptidase Dcp
VDGRRSYVGQSKLLGTRTSSPTTRTSSDRRLDSRRFLTSDNVTTMFHEFGHALHSLFSMVRYPECNGIVRDFTEFSLSAQRALGV